MKKIVTALITLSMIIGNSFVHAEGIDGSESEDTQEITEESLEDEKNAAESFEEQDKNSESESENGYSEEEPSLQEEPVTETDDGTGAVEFDENDEETFIEGSKNNEQDSNDSLYEEKSTEKDFLGNEIIDIPVVYSTNGYTQDRAVAYARSLVGEHWDVDNGSVDCVDIIKKYFLDVGGLEYLRQGNAGVYATTATIPNGWTRMYMSNGYAPQPGDVACWDFGAYMWNFSLPYGHVGIVTSVSGNTITDYRLMLVSTTKDGVIGDIDYFVGLSKLDIYKLDETDDSILVRGLSLDELEGLIKNRRKRILKNT